MPSGKILMNAFGANSPAGAAAHAVAASSVSMYAANMMPPPAIALTWRKLRRSIRA